MCTPKIVHLTYDDGCAIVVSSTLFSLWSFNHVSENVEKTPKPNGFADHYPNYPY